LKFIVFSYRRGHSVAALTRRMKIENIPRQSIYYLKPPWVDLGVKTKLLKAAHKAHKGTLSVVTHSMAVLGQLKSKTALELIFNTISYWMGLGLQIGS